MKVQFLINNLGDFNDDGFILLFLNHIIAASTSSIKIPANITPTINPVFGPDVDAGDGKGVGQLELSGERMFTHAKQLTSNKYIFGLVSYD
ncbi:16421_t:CDS:2, partial [Gigaspora rosea]